MEYLTFLVILFVITFGLRFAARVKRRSTEGSDAYTHLFIADAIRRSGHHIPEKMPQALINGKLSYPFLFHWLLSFFSREGLELIEPYLSPLLDAFQCSIIYIAAFTIFSCGYLPVQDPSLAAFIAGFIFATMPILIHENAGQFILSARPLGNFLFVSASSLGLLFLWSNNWIFFVLSLVIFSLMLLASKFATQNFVFISLYAFIVTRNIIFLLIPFLAIIFALILTLGKFKQILIGHLSHMYAYVKYLQFNHGMVRKRMITPFKSLLNALKALEHGLSVKSIYKVLQALLYCPFYFGFFQMPMLILFAMFLLKDATQNSSTLNNPYYLMLVFWIGGGVALFLLISLPFLRFLGEPDRYLTFIVFPLSLVLSFRVVNGQLSVLAFIICAITSLLIAFYNIFMFIFSTKHNSAMREAAAFLKQQPRTDILCIPITISRELMYRTQHNFVDYPGVLSNSPQKCLSTLKFLYPEDYPLPRRDLNIFSDKFNVTLLVVWKLLGEKLKRYDLSGFALLYENGSVGIYRFPNQKGKAS